MVQQGYVSSYDVIYMFIFSQFIKFYQSSALLINTFFTLVCFLCVTTDYCYHWHTLEKFPSYDLYMSSENVKDSSMYVHKYGELI